jgi:hypothetical protein
MIRIDNFIERHFLPKTISQEFDVNKYLSDFKNGEFKDKFCLGVLEKNSGEWLLKDFFDSPNGLFIGKMGSGKSQAAKFSLFTWMIANSHKTQLFIIDTVKGAGDYSIFFRKDKKTGERIYSQVYEATESIEKAKRIIDLVYGEYEERQKIFSSVGSNSLRDYESKSGRTMNRVLTLVEEAYSLFSLLNFEQEVKTNLSSAWKLWTLLKAGRSAGIWFMMCSQKGTKADIPSQVIQNFIKLVFKTSAIESQYLAGSPEGASIHEDEKGRCITEFGFIQYPIIGGIRNELEEQLVEMLDLFIKPLTGEFAFITKQMIKDVIEGDTLKEFYKNKKMAELMMSIESHDSKTVISVLHEKLGHQVSEMEEGNNLYISHIVDVSKDIKIAVITRAIKDRNNVGVKHIQNLVKAMNVYECSKGIIYTSSSKITAQIYKMAKEFNIEIIDHEDLIKFSLKIDKEGNKVKFDPSKIADEAKENGEYQIKNHIEDSSIDDEDGYQTFDQALEKDTSGIRDIFDSSLDNIKKQEPEEIEEEQIPQEEEVSQVETEEYEKTEDEVEPVQAPIIEEKVVEVKRDIKSEISPVLEDAKKEIENILIQKNVLSKIAKKVPAKKVFTLKKDATPTLMVSVHRNDSGALYRIMFLVIEENKVKHQFYVDRQVVDQFSHKEKAMLGITSVDDWNQQKDVFDPDKFVLEVMSFLENFQSCQFPVHSICWKSDVDVLKRYLKPCKYMIDNPQTFEDIMFNNYGLSYSRKDMIEHYSIKVPKNPSIYNPIEMDFNIWTEIN